MHLEENGRHWVAQLVGGDGDELVSRPDSLPQLRDQAILVRLAMLVLRAISAVHTILAVRGAGPSQSLSGNAGSQQACKSPGRCDRLDRPRRQPKPPCCIAVCCVLTRWVR